jgi:hypothetical protein
MNIYERASHLLDPSIFEKATFSETCFTFDFENIPKEPQYILRMMVYSPETDGELVIPPELEWMREELKTIRILRNYFLRNEQPYIYVTVRHGEVTSVTDDEWHVDGFSMRVPHVPEQNYIWTNNKYTTQLLNQKFKLPDDFDPMKHNIHTFFQSRAKESNIVECRYKYLYLIDPYVVHRRPKIPDGTKRTFIRISFVPIEIEDDTCTPNPLLPRKVYGRQDIRKKLVPYTFKNAEDRLAYEMKYGHLF